MVVADQDALVGAEAIGVGVGGFDAAMAGLIQEDVIGRIAAGGGHVINVSSIGVLTNAPRFSAYVASKAALEAFSRCAAAEYAHEHVIFTVINMPLVRTPMIAPTKAYEGIAALTSEEAGEWMITAARTRPVRIAPRMAIAAKALDTFGPRLVNTLMARQRMQPNRSGGA